MAENASRDRGILKRLKFREVTAFSSLRLARRHLEIGKPDMALVDSALEDMDGCECLRAIKKDRKLPIKALVMVTADSRRHRVLEAIAAGCAGYVIRPYSIETLERHMRAAWNSLLVDEIDQLQLDQAKSHLQRQEYDLAISEFEEVLGEAEEALGYFKRGMEYLRQGKFGKAILSFNKAVALNDMYAEAYQGLAHAHKGKGNEEQYLEFLKRSGELYAQQDKLQEVKEVFVEILQADPEAVNPYNTLGVRLRRSGDHAGALRAYSQALEVTPDDENLHYNIAKAYLHAGDMSHAVEHLDTALRLRPDFQEAMDLAVKIEAGQTAGEEEYAPAQRPDSTLVID